MWPLDYLFSPWKNRTTQDFFFPACFFISRRRAGDVSCEYLGRQAVSDAFPVYLFFGHHRRLEGLSANGWTSGWLGHWTIISFVAFRLCLGERPGWCMSIYINMIVIWLSRQRDSFWRIGVFSFAHLLEIPVARLRTLSKRGLNVAASASVQGTF